MIRLRVLKTVHAWIGNPKEFPIPTNKLLARIWERHRDAPYDAAAKQKLISLLHAQFPNFRLHLQPGSFEKIRKVQDLIDHIEKL